MTAPAIVTVEELPVLPAVLVRLMALDPEDDSVFDEVVALATLDPTFAVRVVHALNKADTAPDRPIETLRGAIARLGAAHIRGLVTSLAVAEVFVPRTAHEVDLWVHAVEVATACRLIARDAPRHVDEHQAHLCGLLHDIGRFVMFDQTPERLRVVNELDWDDPDELVAAEVREFGYSHAEIGHALCVKWGLPAHLARVIREHHRSMDVLVPGRADDDLLAVVMVANGVSRLALAGALTPVLDDHRACTALLAAHGLDLVHPASPIRASHLATLVPAMVAAGRAARHDLALPPFGGH